MLDPDPHAAAQKQALAVAVEITRDVFKHLHITKVVFVDDHAKPRAGLDETDVSTAILDQQLAPADLASAAPVLVGVITDPDGTTYDIETAAAEVVAWWAGANDQEKQAVLRAFHDATGGPDEGASTSTDAAAISRVQELVPRGVQFEALLPSEWAAFRDGGKLVGRKRKGAAQPKTLVVFDRDLSEEPGFRADEGEELLAQLLQGDAGEHCYAALVSHYVGTAEETAHWYGMEQQRGLDRTRFIVISKARLADERNEFAHRLRAMLLAPRLAEIAGTVADAYVAAVEAARSELVGLPLPASEQAVLGCAAKEGLWEPDVLLRLLEGHVRDAVRAQIRADARLHELVTELRQAAGVRQEPKPGAAAEELWRMQRREAYSDYAYLSGLRLPLEPGDILRVVPFDPRPGPWDRAQDETYLLVTEQDCDLHIRDDGKRNRSPQRLGVVPVVLTGKEGPTTFRLPWFCPATGVDAFAVLNKERDIPALSLDLAAVGEDGFASFTAGDKAAAVLIPTWERRHRRIAADVGAILDEYRAAADGISDAASRHVLMSLTLATRDSEIPVNVDGKTLAFGLQRIARLLPPWRTDLFQRLSLLGQRVAYEGDFAPENTTG